MSSIVLTQASSGAPTCNGVNGSMTAIMRWALAQKSWAEEYGGGSGNAAVFRAATGKRYRILVNHDSAASGNARLSIFRAAESATSTSSFTDQFPTTSQVADGLCNMILSSTADSTARDYILIVDNTWFIFFVRYNGTNWDGCFFGDPPGTESGDTYGSCIIQRNSSGVSNATGIAGWNAYQDAPTYSHSVNWCRERAGTTKSTSGCLASRGFGFAAGEPAGRAGYGNQVRREKVAINCSGSISIVGNDMRYTVRGWLPHLWSMLHNGIGSVANGDTLTDSVYNASATFKVITANSASGTRIGIVETSDATWAPPGG